MKSSHNFIQSTVVTAADIIVIIALAWFMVHSFLSQDTINGHSMEPRFSDGDVVLVDTLMYQFIDPHRLDVVIFKKGDSSLNTKRIVGLPGETITIQNGHIYIDGKLLDTDKISDISLPGIAGNPIELMDDEYFLIGDNADSSEDSRFENVGNVKKSQLVGKVWFRIGPLKRFGFIG